MGIALNKSKLAVACKHNVRLLKNFPQLAPSYPARPNTYDAFFVPVCSYNSGKLDLHDLNFLNNKLTGINTLFSCIAEINNEYSFEPVWQPPFISDLLPEDRCHLNGMAVKDEKIEYVTALSSANTARGWRNNKMDSGVIINVPDNKVVLDNLSMPHSPRIYNNKLYFLNSSLGELRLADTDKRTSKVIVQLGGYARGMAKYGDYLFIGISKLRHSTPPFNELPIAKTSFAGVVVVDLPGKKVIGQIRFETSVDEIYDVKILPDYRRPGIITNNRKESKMFITMPSDTFWEAKEKSE